MAQFPQWLPEADVPPLASRHEVARIQRIKDKITADNLPITIIGDPVTTMQFAPPGADLRFGPYLLNAEKEHDKPGMPAKDQGQRFSLVAPEPGAPAVVIDIYYGDGACLDTERRNGLPNADGRRLIQVAVYINGVLWRPIRGAPRLNVIV